MIGLRELGFNPFGHRYPTPFRSLWDMYQFNAEAFYKAISDLRRSQTLIDMEGDAPKAVPLSDQAAHTFDLITASLGLDAAILNTNYALKVIMEFRAELEKGICTYAKAAERIKEIDTALRRELSVPKIFVVDARRANYHSVASELMGDEVAERFPKAIDDIEGAGHCLAFGEGMATVLHLMRVMETGLKELAAKLGIPYMPSWDAYLKKITDRLNEKHDAKTPEWKQDEPFFRDISGDLMTVKNAWRNPTMHVDRKYSAEEAEEIFLGVRLFMRRLALKV